MKKTTILSALLICTGLFSFTKPGIHNKKVLSNETITITDISLTSDPICDGDEPIYFSGTAIVVNQFIVNNNQFTYKGITNMQGVSGVGLISGRKYIFVSNSQISFNGSVSELPMTQGVFLSNMIVSPGSNGNLVSKIGGSITLTPDGIVSFGGDWTTGTHRCKGQR